MPRKTQRAKQPPRRPSVECSKVRYRSRLAAEQAITARDDDLILTTYLCPTCGSWHLTRAAQA